ncbi:TPA: site-specific DNA-methyltransferase [Proteus mirabilis]|uniref:site-specific DNA-methyltransferase n=2 Tax=Morganellaceae TaxID=1903414 RepID=UPI0018C6168D|nr:site-specific DNA-methyltransferase [Proteus mirabilis]EJG2211547.1 site-specific DNA-methyltransferase [Proteus mirabilis]EKX2216207.1 site-specific DNA-methyltransferase [Proteus mirabilis]EKX4939802.1 site-specific DNA-methyltransferase [Proteus mirabilis]EKX6492749.1 site-specific DNA-methyltransferase [Proteus mirabilis]
MMSKTKLELTWIGKNERKKLEPRILLEDPSKSYHASQKVTENDIFDNKLIFGDNLLALKALEQEYAGQVKCIYIDPPYNTGNAFEHYDDGLENSIWLSLMKSRLEILEVLLHENGFIAVQIDDRQFARLYLIMAEIFGEQNLKTICVKMSEPTGVKMASINKNGSIAKLKEYIILAGKSGIRGLTLEKIPKGSWDYEYKTVCLGLSQLELEYIKDVLDNELRTEEEIKRAEDLAKKLEFCSATEACKKEGNSKLTEEWLFDNAWRVVQFATITGGARDLAVEKKLSYGDIPSAFIVTTKQSKAYLVRGEFNHETRLPRCKMLFADKYLEVHPGDFWHDIKTTGLDNEGSVDFKNGKKPEKLVKRIIAMTTRPGDLVLDSFGGSGTTGAVAHKMGRRWIMVELGEHCHTHIIPRLQKVIDGEDQGGISKFVNWQGGGGFRYYKLAPTLIVKDKFGLEVINKEYNPEMLAEAVCKLEGFTYAPSEVNWWDHGYSTETDHIYVTTQSLSVDKLEALSEEVGSDRTLLVMCGAFRCEPGRFANLTLKKLPKAILNKCQFGQDDYSLNVANLTDDASADDDAAQD